MVFYSELDIVFRNKKNNWFVIRIVENVIFFDSKWCAQSDIGEHISKFANINRHQHRCSPAFASNNHVEPSLKETLLKYFYHLNVILCSPYWMTYQKYTFLMSCWIPWIFSQKCIFHVRIQVWPRSPEICFKCQFLYSAMQKRKNH